MFFLLLLVHTSETPLPGTGPAKYSDFRKKVAAIVFIVNKETVFIIQQSVMLLQIFQGGGIRALHGIALGNTAFQCSLQAFLLLAQGGFTDGADPLYKKNKQDQKGQNRKQKKKSAPEGYMLLLKTIQSIALLSDAGHDTHKRQNDR